MEEMKVMVKNQDHLLMRLGHLTEQVGGFVGCYYAFPMLTPYRFTTASICGVKGV